MLGRSVAASWPSMRSVQRPGRGGVSSEPVTGGSYVWNTRSLRRLVSVCVLQVDAASVTDCIVPYIRSSRRSYAPRVELVAAQLSRHGADAVVHLLQRGARALQAVDVRLERPLALEQFLPG